MKSIISEINVYKLPYYGIPDEKKDDEELGYKFSIDYKRLEKYILDESDGKYFENKKYEKNRKRLNEQLSNDESFHYRYFTEFECIVYGDIDKCETEEKVIEILKYISKKYETDFENMAYTLSNPEINSYGSHWTIPSIQTNMSSLKIMMTEVMKIYNTEIKYIDVSVYKNNGWLRLPNQTNNEKKTIHKIIQGEPINFLLHYVEDTEFTSYREEEIIEYPKLLIKQNIEPNYKLLNELSDEFQSGYERWRNMAFFMKNLNYTYDDFLSMSRGKDFAGEKKCDQMWKSTRIKEGITEAYFYSRLKETKPDVFTSLNLKFDYPITSFINEDEIIKMSQRRLIPSLENPNIDDMNDVLPFNINKLFNSDNKSLSIKSPYDTGKTTLLSLLIKKYEPKKILWLSYRKTLTNDILGSFSKEFNFKDYQDKDYDAERLIIQLESLIKLKPYLMFADDEIEIPSYDLIIIDEIESILNHFNPTTFKGGERDVFNWMVEIIKVSKKMIVLDGDISNRTYNFLNNFGTSINIVNDIKINKKNFVITTNKEIYLKEIKRDIEQNNKIVIASMSSKQCNNIFDEIRSICENKKVLIYTGQSSDNTKDDLKEVNKNWSDCDVLIYSPTIESGVNFDMKHFKKLYGIICLGSTTQRAFCQMLSRVRKFEEDTITILNVNFQLKINDINDNNRYYYDEVKNSMINLDVIKMKEVINNGKIKKELDLYDSNYIFNKIEFMYKNDYYFLAHLRDIVISKGHTFELDQTEYKKKKKEKDKEKSEDILLSIPNINRMEYEQLLSKQAECQASELDKLKIKKYVFMKSLGVDDLNQELINDYDFSTIKKYVGLMNIENITKSSSNHYVEEVKRVEIIQKLINDLGFKNMYDRKTILNKDEFLSRIENLESFNDDKGLRILFNCRSIQKNFDSIKSFLGCVNSMLLPYSLKVQSNRKKEDNKETYNYSLDKIKERIYIDELLQYKINKGYKINTDIRVYTPTEYYKDLVKEVKEIDNDEKVIFIESKN